MITGVTSGYIIVQWCSKQETSSNSLLIQWELRLPITSIPYHCNTAEETIALIYQNQIRIYTLYGLFHIYNLYDPQLHSSNPFETDTVMGMSMLGRSCSYLLDETTHDFILSTYDGKYYHAQISSTTQNCNRTQKNISQDNSSSISHLQLLHLFPIHTRYLEQYTHRIYIPFANHISSFAFTMNSTCNSITNNINNNGNINHKAGITSGNKGIANPVKTSTLPEVHYIFLVAFHPYFGMQLMKGVLSPSMPISLPLLPTGDYSHLQENLEMLLLHSFHRDTVDTVRNCDMLTDVKKIVSICSIDEGTIKYTYILYCKLAIDP